jgi:hypothetical protein
LAKNNDVLEKLINARADLPRSERQGNRRTYKQKVALGLLGTGPNIGKSATMSLAEFHRLAACHTAAALKTASEIMITADPKTRLMAAELLIRCAWGNPVTPIEHGGSISVTGGARERLLAVLERVGEHEVKALTGASDVVDAEVVEEKTDEILAGSQTVRQAAVNRPIVGSSPTPPEVLKPPARKPDDP